MWKSTYANRATSRAAVAAQELITRVLGDRILPAADPAVVAARTGTLVVGLVACGVPARRALRIEATEAVRHTG